MSGPAAASSFDLSQLRLLVETKAPAQELCSEIAKRFKVRPSEIALLRLEQGLLRFVFPPELSSAGSIPQTSSGVVAAQTANTRRGERFNAFHQVKHASIFESVPLKASENGDTGERTPIQKLMSCPILGEDGRIAGVIQVSRKAMHKDHAGPDFSPEDLQQLGQIAKILVGAVSQ